MADPDPAPSPPSGGIPQPPRPGAAPSAPSGSQYMPELPYAEELQTLLEGRYVVESFLGQGGMGAVYKGLQLPLKRPVAIKILQKQGEKGDFDFEERFKREAYAMASLTHPNIVQVYDCGDAGENFLFISMELVEGGDLSDAIKAGQVTPELALKLIPQICDGLQAAHERGIVHRDIKPANIFLTADGRAKVADFGLAKKFDVKSTFVTKAGLGMGTPDYAAPEQFEGVADIDHRADIYSLGVMFYQMLTGKLPRGIWQKPSKLKPMDPRLDAIASRSMEQDRSERYQSVAEMKADILQCRAMPAGATEVMPSGAVPPTEAPMPTLTGRAPSAPPRTGNMPSSPPRTGNVPSSPPRTGNVHSSPSPTRTGNVPAALTNTGKVPAFVRPTAKPPARTGAVGAAPLPADATLEAPLPKSRAGMLVGIIGAVVALAVAAFFVLKPKPAPPGAPPSEPPTSYASTPSAPRESTSAPRPAPSAISTTPATASPSVSPPSISPSDFPASILTFAGHRYQALPDLLTWTEARGKAEQMGGHLATITSLEENEWIKATFITRLPKGLGLWLGGTNDGKPAEWRWVTGEPFKFTAWNLKEPNNAPREIGITFSFTDEGELGWADMSDSGFGRMDRRAGLLVEWEDTTSPIKVPLASSGPAPGTLNLLQGLDPARDAIEGDWVMKEDGLNCDRGRGFARLAFNVPVPQEYDFRIRFTRKSGGQAVTQHIVLPDGRDVMWLMGGFNNDVFAWERVGGKLGNANPTTVKMGLQNGRRYECVVKVRKNQLQVELDGKVISTQGIANNQLDVVEAWKFPDSKKLGIGCQTPTLFHSVELIPFGDTALASTPAASTMPSASSPVPPPAPPSPPPPSPTPNAAAPPANPRVAQLQAGFKNRYDTEVLKPYNASVNSLNQSYQAGIARARSAAQQKGALDEVTALDAEKTRVSSHAPLPPSDDDALPRSLKTLRGTYRTELGKIDASRAKSAGPLYDLYLGALDSYIAELAKGNKTDDAQKVQAMRDEIAAQKMAVMEGSTLPSTAAAATATSPPVPSPTSKSSTRQATASSSGPPIPIPPEALTPPKKAEHSRELAEWTLIKCRGRLYVGEGKQTKRYAATNPNTPLNPEDLPKGSFNMTLLDSGNSNRAPVDTNWVEGETALEELALWQVDFASPLALRGMKKLNILRIRGSATALPDEQMLLWPPLPALKQLDIQGAFGNTGLRVLCERCPEINRLVLQARLTAGGLAPLQRLKNLNYFEMQGGSLPAGDLGLLASLPKLEKVNLSGVALGSADFSSLVNLTELSVSNTQLSESDVKSLSSLKKLTTLRFGGNQLTDASLPVLATLPKLQNLELNGSPISGSTFASLSGMKSLTRLSLIATKISDDTLAALPPMPALTDLRIQDNAAIGDGAASAIGKHRSIAKLDVGTTGMGDAGLQILCNELPNLTELYLYNTKVTDAGLTALKRLKKIERLNFGDTTLTDAAVEHLKKITTLRSIELRNTQVSAKGVAELQKALPQCQVSSN